MPPETNIKSNVEIRRLVIAALVNGMGPTRASKSY